MAADVHRDVGGVNLADGDGLLAASRSPQIMADAAAAILTMPTTRANGRSFIDADVLAESGITDLSSYGGGGNPKWDIFVDAPGTGSTP